MQSNAKQESGNAFCAVPASISQKEKFVSASAYFATSATRNRTSAANALRRMLAAVRVFIY